MRRKCCISIGNDLDMILHIGTFLRIFIFRQ